MGTSRGEGRSAVSKTRDGEMNVRSVFEPYRRQCTCFTSLLSFVPSTANGAGSDRPSGSWIHGPPMQPHACKCTTFRGRGFSGRRLRSALAAPLHSDHLLEREESRLAISKRLQANLFLVQGARSQASSAETPRYLHSTTLRPLRTSKKARRAGKPCPSSLVGL